MFIEFYQMALLCGGDGGDGDGGVLSVRSCRVQQMLFVAAQAIVIES